MVASDVALPARAIKPRSPALELDDRVPRHWFGGNAAATHIANGVNLLFPAGERFFVRSVRRYLDRVKDERLRAQVTGFFGQEGRHAGAHERFFEVLEAQGFAVRPFLRVYERIAYGFIERVAPDELGLAVTVACEHFTAIMARNALGDSTLERAHPAVKALLSWHAAEEIEHKSVAFDVLREVNPSYALRMAGLGTATLCLGGFWLAAAVTLMHQDPHADRARLLRELAELRRTHPILKRVFVRGIREYARRDFHPSQVDDHHLAEAYLAAVGLA